MKCLRIVSPLQRTQDDDGERGGIFQSIGQMLATPARSRRPVAPHPGKFNQTLSQPDHAGDGNDDWHQKRTPTAPIRLGCTDSICRKEHACRDKQVTHDFGVTRENISENDVAKFAILNLCQSTHTDPLQGGQEMQPTGPRHAFDGEDKTQDNKQQERLGQDLPGEDGMFVTTSDGPEEKQRGHEGDREDRG